jgi:hypothetical protein
MRITQIQIKNSTGAKKERFAAKLDYLRTLPAFARFHAGSKQQGEGGWN